MISPKYIPRLKDRVISAFLMLEVEDFSLDVDSEPVGAAFIFSGHQITFTARRVEGFSSEWYDSHWQRLVGGLKTPARMPSVTYDEDEQTIEVTFVVID